MRNVLSRLASLLLAVLFVLGLSVPVFAQPAPGGTDETQVVDPKQAELKAYRQNTAWYDPTAGLCDPNSSTSLVGKDNVQKAFNFFISKRLTPAQAAGIVGNLRQESGEGINPKAPNPAAEGGGGGIAQWEGGRWSGPDGLLAFAEKAGKPWDDLGVQLDFIWYEMPKQFAYGRLGYLQAVLPQATASTSSFDAVKMSNTYEIATQAWEFTYERADPDAANIPRRIQLAGEVMAQLGGTTGGGPDSATGCGGSGILVGEYAFPLAPQTKRNYGYTLPCEEPKTNGPYTVNSVYTDIFGRSTNVRACHHDATPAFDLSYGAAETGGKPVYAITKGTIVSVSPFGTCNEIQFKADIASDKTYYWYGHVVATRDPGPVNAGDQIAVVAPQSYGPSCWMGGVHVHVDRGCVIGGTPGDLTSGEPQTAGRKGCRNPQFLDDLVKIWEALPAP